ncbi:hypothetical protein [Phaeospirillum tilakii]|uniref:SMODS and SLOG-associating 2TM effector domain-containing protein n=1 Tax=Phaeospirillum tilakii TaxID=741673 RepID=A0ABW5CCM2_9PROT
MADDYIPSLRSLIIQSKNNAFRRAAFFYYSDSLSRLTAAVCSFAAGLFTSNKDTLNSITGNGNTEFYLSLLSFAPAAILGWVGLYNPGMASKWQWQRYFGLIALQRRLDYEGASEAEISAELSRMERQQLASWTPFNWKEKTKKPEPN